MAVRKRQARGDSGYWRNSRSDKIARSIARFDDPLVRDLLEGAFETIRAELSPSSLKSHLLPLHEAIESVPLDACGVDDVADALRIEARRRRSQLKQAKDKPAKNVIAIAVNVIARIFEHMAGLDLESKDPRILWIRENQEMLGATFETYAAIGKVIYDSKDAGFFRMADVGRKTPQLLEFDTDARFIQNLAIEVAEKHILPIPAENRNHSIQGLRTVCRSFSESLGGDVPGSLAELGDRHLAMQMDFHRGDGFALWALTRFYLVTATRQGRGSLLAAEGVTVSFLSNAQFSDAYLGGYRAVMLNPLDPPPSHDRWFVFPNGTEDDYASGKPNKGHRADFSQIDERLRAQAKRWFWEDGSSLLDRARKLQGLAAFLSWRQQSTTFINLEHETYLIRSEEVELYLLASRSDPDSTLRAKKTKLASFIDFLEQDSPESVDPLCRYVIGGIGDGLGEGREERAMPRAHYQLIESELERRSPESTADLMNYAAFLLLGIMPPRPSSVLDLKLSHIVESARAGKHAIRQPSKTTGRDARDHELHPKAKKALDRVIRETQPLRDEAPEGMRDYVFLVRSASAKGGIIVLPDNTFKHRLRRLCSELGIPKYGPADIRRRYMTDADDAADALGMGQGAKSAMTGHVDPATDRKHYIRHDVVEYYEALYGVEIGTAKIRGTLSAVSPEGFSESDEVAGGSGWCDSDGCGGVASCLMCSHFRTTPSQIPAFKANIEAIDRKIASVDTDHDRGHLAAFKALHVAYICELEKLKERMEGGAS